MFALRSIANWRPQTSLRAALATIGLLCVALVFIGRQERRLAAYRELGRSCELNDDGPYEHAFNGVSAGEGYQWLTPPRYRRYIRDLIAWGDGKVKLRPDEAFGDLTSVDFAKLRYFPEIDQLQICGTTEESQLLSITGVPNLKRLQIISRGLTDRVVGHFADGCPALVEIVLGADLDAEPLSDAALDHVCRLSNLRSVGIGIEPTRFTPRGVAKLRVLKKLEWVSLGSQYDDRALRELGVTVTPRTNEDE